MKRSVVFSSAVGSSVLAVHLSRRHRAWIALYAVEAGAQPLAEILRVNNVTPQDLREHEESWLRMRCRPGAGTS
ncbi:hypothetical protein LJY25_07215 [Hymenobacter sp. BT175]|uniref:hypothetical protein n=1 Tax=Hymenobacter translucens TaxID=2886507 RepID=UPI001D0E2843|nr:hypothetical protein [Hymenobacter translucens]MCC2546229.1 hypothetical protein [Hymenobacter translucens]